uniref:Uncharacterized protein n=1 Tax=Siphoviridae sp. ctkkB9 TaxID=2825644 RepID=A0A8S5TZG8_9CAUD|nr:MAG TPA: hypothetical protein [Siphoviridae sp. ctkkB9]
MCQQNRITQAAVAESVRVQVVSRKPHLKRLKTATPAVANLRC